MLTVRVMRPDDSEWIEEATSACLNTSHQSASGRQSVTYFRNGQAFDVYEGYVYVMNDNGKTIGNYDLGAPPTNELAGDARISA